MRPMSRRALLVIACAVVVGGWTLAIAAVWMGVAGQVAQNVVAAVERSVSAAHAEDMKFEPLSADSASNLERRRARRTSTSVSIPPAPAVPNAPGVADVPETPSVVIGKSGDIMRVGSDVTVGKDDVVTGDVLAVGGDLTIEGHVEGNAVSMGGDIYLKSGARVDGDVVCMGGQLHEESGATVGGKRVVGLGGKGLRSSRDLRHDFDIDVDSAGSRRGRGDLGGSLAWLLVWLLIGWAIVKITPARTAAALDSFRRGPGSSFLVGWLALVLTVPGLIAVALLTALLCITIIGIPLGIAVLFGYFLFLAVFVVWGGVVGAAIIGERIAARQGVPAATLMRAMVTGVLALSGAMVVAQLMQAVGFVPMFGGLGKFLWVLLLIANILIGVAGWGALLYSEFTTGLIARWWHGRRTPPTPPPAAVPPPAGSPPSGGSGTAVTTVEVPTVTPPPVPPAPPASYMPPPEAPPPAAPSGS